MLGIRTDLKVPDKVDSVGIYMQRIEDGRATTLAPIEVKAQYGPSGKEVHLPGSLAIENPGHPNVRVRVRIVAYDGAGAPLVMREARVQVPTNRVASLPMPLLWLNTDDVKDADPSAGGPVPVETQGLRPLQEGGHPVDGFGRFRSDFCGDEHTLDDRGACADIEIDVAGLEDYTPGAPLPDLETSGDRGAPATGEGVAQRPFCPANESSLCFDLARCLASGDDDPNYRPIEIAADRIEGLGTANCSVVLDGVPAMSVTDVALGVKTSETEGATCTTGGACFIALDETSGATLDAASRRLTLPPGVCRKASKGSVLAVVASPLCKRRKAEQVTCSNQSCMDGSGWNGERDPGLPPGPPDGGEPDAGACATIAGATGFWVDDTNVTLLGGGSLTRFDVAQLAGACLVGAPRITTPTPEIANVPYRLLGSNQSDFWPGLVTFSSSTAATLPNAGILAGTLRPILEQDDVDVFHGAAFVRGDGQTVFDAVTFFGHHQPLPGGPSELRRVRYSSDGSFVAESGLPLSRRIDKGSNVIARNGLFIQAARFDATMGTVLCTTSCTVEPAPLALDATPLFLATGQDDETFLLASSTRSAIVIPVDVSGLLRNDNGKLEFPNADNRPVPDEMTLAIAGQGSSRRLYFANHRHLLMQSPEEPVQQIATAEDRGMFHAVQVRGNALYWLQSDAAGRATVHRRELDARGRVRDP